MVIKASNLFSIVLREGGGWSGVLLLQVSRVQGSSISLLVSTGAWFCNHLSISNLGHLILPSLLTVSCSSVTWCIRSSTCLHLVLALTSAPEEVYGHSLQAAACTDVSFITSSVWVEASDITGAPAVGALVLALRRVPTIMAETWNSPLGCGLQAVCRALPARTAMPAAAPCPDCRAALLKGCLSPAVAAGKAHAYVSPAHSQAPGGCHCSSLGFPWLREPPCAPRSSTQPQILPSPPLPFLPTQGWFWQEGISSSLFQYFLLLGAFWTCGWQDCSTLNSD